MFPLSSKSGGTRGKGLWKHNNSLCENSTYINSMKKHVISTLENLKKENITDEQCLWEYLKHKIRKFSKTAARSNKIESSALETNLKSVIEMILKNLTKKNLINYIKEKLTVL